MIWPVLPSRPEQQTPWFRRRDTLKAAAAWLAMGGLPAAMAQQRSNLVQLLGNVQLNGQRLLPDQTVQTGDQLQTGLASSVIFVIGDSAFHVRANSRLSLERGKSLTTVSQLRLHAGAVASVWAQRARRVISGFLQSSGGFSTSGAGLFHVWSTYGLRMAK